MSDLELDALLERSKYPTPDAYANAALICDLCTAVMQLRAELADSRTAYDQLLGARQLTLMERSEENDTLRAERDAALESFERWRERAKHHAAEVLELQAERDWLKSILDENDIYYEGQGDDGKYDDGRA